jgi:hypothetical protein
MNPIVLFGIAANIAAAVEFIKCVSQVDRFVKIRGRDISRGVACAVGAMQTVIGDLGLVHRATGMQRRNEKSRMLLLSRGRNERQRAKRNASKQGFGEIVHRILRSRLPLNPAAIADKFQRVSAWHRPKVLSKNLN